MKNVLKPLTKNLLITLGLTTISATDAIIKKFKVWVNNTNNVKRRNGRPHENSYASRKFYPIDKSEQKNNQKKRK